MQCHRRSPEDDASLPLTGVRDHATAAKANGVLFRCSGICLATQSTLTEFTNPITCSTSADVENVIGLVNKIIMMILSFEAKVTVGILIYHRVAGFPNPATLRPTPKQTYCAPPSLLPVTTAFSDVTSFLILVHE